MVSGTDFPYAVLSSLKNGTAIKPTDGLMIYHIGGYDSWFEKSVLSARQLARLPMKTNTFTICFKPEHKVYVQIQLNDYLLEVRRNILAKELKLRLASSELI
jgi:hypothetical protein